MKLNRNIVGMIATFPALSVHTDSGNVRTTATKLYSSCRFSVIFGCMNVAVFYEYIWK